MGLMPVQNKTIIGFVLLLLFSAVLWAYNAFQSTESRFSDDPQAERALELVKNHLSREGYTLAESLQLLVDRLEEKAVPYREGDWRVASQGPDTYVVSKIVREKGSVEWIEREYAWRVNVKEQSIRVISLAAQQLMPFENLPPLPHGEEISRLPSFLVYEGLLG